MTGFRLNWVFPFNSQGTDLYILVFRWIHTFVFPTWMFPVNYWFVYSIAYLMSPLRWHLRQASQTHLVQKVFSSKPVWIDCLSDFSRWQPHPSSGSGLNLKCYLFSHTWKPFYKQSLLALSSKYIWNLTTSYYLHYYLNYCNTGLPDLILPPLKSIYNPAAESLLILLGKI